MFTCFSSFSQSGNSPIVISDFGKYPFAYIDDKGIIHVVFCHDNKLFYSFSEDEGGIFSKPQVIPETENFKFSAPHLTSTKDYIVVAANYSNNMYTWRKKRNEKEWDKEVKINDMEGAATEGFVSIAGRAKDNFIYAVWVDEREKSIYKVYRSFSIDGSQTWAKNKSVYQSPDGSVCPCCKPTLALHSDTVYVMFRNDIKGARNMYLLFSDDEGERFEPARKLGAGSWQLNGCPVDGGGITVDKKGRVFTAWRRANEIFLAEPEKLEAKVGLGRLCKIANSSKGLFVAWLYEGNINVRLPNSKIIVLGKGQQPEIASVLTKPYAVCVWTNEGRVFAQKVLVTKN